MAQSNLNQHQSLPQVQPTNVKTWLTEDTMSPLGKELMKIANEIENSDETAFDETDIENELNRRRGGYEPDGE